MPDARQNRDSLLIRQAFAYVIELYRELTQENGAPISARRTRRSISSSPIRSCASGHAMGSDRRNRRGDDRAAAAACRADAALPSGSVPYLQAMMEQPVFDAPRPGAGGPALIF